MSSYRLARRSFLAAVGGAVGLRMMLDNFEALAGGVTTSPRRFLLWHFPLGTMRYRFVPEGAGATYTPSVLSQPFEDAGLRQDMTIFYGFSDAHLTVPGGGGHEGGTVFTTTCCSAEGTRANGGETDDAVAGGPSFDQIFFDKVPGMKDGGAAYANALCDARVDSNETSTQCLSYAYDTRSVTSARVADESITENAPLLPELSPATLYAQLFSGFMPGGATEANQERALNALLMRKSVLDHSLAELERLKTLAPSSEAPKIELHAEAIRKVELQLSQQIEAGAIAPGGCDLPAAPDPELMGETGNEPYMTNNVKEDDSPKLRQLALAHSAVLLAAFQCDIIRAGTFQYCPGQNHVSFAGMWPSDPMRIAMHHPVSHMSGMIANAANVEPPAEGEARDVYEFLVNVQLWFNSLTAEILGNFKTATDAFGNGILDYTVIPHVTEVSGPNHSRSPKPAYLFGGSALGLQHGTFQNFEERRPQVDLYLTAAQAMFGSSDVMTLLADERFMQFNPEAAVIPGLWQAPA